MRTRALIPGLTFALASSGLAQMTPPLPVPVGQPAAVVDLMTIAGAKTFNAEWRYSDAKIVETAFTAPAPPGSERNAQGPANTTYDIAPRAGEASFDDSTWEVIGADTLGQRRSGGKVCFNWYRMSLTLPANVGGFETAGATAVLKVTVDDYAEVWVNGQLPRTLDGANPNLVQGFNVPNRVTIARDLKPGDRIQIAIFGINGPISAAPTNYIWFREAKVEFFSKPHAIAPRQVDFEIVRNDAAIDSIVSRNAVMEQIVEGLVFGEGPVWVPASGQVPAHLLFSDPNANTIYQWSEDVGLKVFLPGSGYSGADVSRFRQPGSNGLTLDSQNRLVINQHGNRRVIRLEADGTQTVLADRFEGKRLNSPNDLVYRSDGTLLFTDPPFGLPMAYDDPDRELGHFGVYALVGGSLRLLTADLKGPNGIALSPDEKHLYVANWDEQRKIIMRYDLAADASVSNGRVFFDMTAAPGEEALDGLEVDAGGNVFCSGPGGVWIISAEGQHLGTIKAPQLPANMAWGDPDRRTLYLAARSAIYRVRLNVTGSPAGAMPR